MGNAYISAGTAAKGPSRLSRWTPDGHVVWKNIRGGIADAKLIAADGKTVYVYNSRGPYAPISLYKLDASTGQYVDWSKTKSTDLSLKTLLGDASEKDSQPTGLAAGGGCAFVSLASLDTVLMLNADSGELIKQWKVTAPAAMWTHDGRKLFVTSQGRTLPSIDTGTGEAKTFAQPALVGQSTLSAVTGDASGNVYVGVRGGDSQVLVYSSMGDRVSAIGRQGGRIRAGAWNPDGMFNIAGLAVDPKGKLWVAENDGSPRRVSVWDTRTGKFIAEYLGPTSYGAPGGAIDPIDSNRMVG
jgi:sugar lactone lactonase YvrE